MATMQNVTATLRQAGYRAAKTQRLNVVKAGYKASKMNDGEVRVYHFGLMNRDNSGLPKYQAALEAAGFTVEARDSFITVTGKDA